MTEPCATCPDKEDEEPVVEVPRRKRKKIDHSPLDHRCSSHHVRVPPHYRIKRGKKKKVIPGVDLDLSKSSNHVKVPAHCRLKRGKKPKKRIKFITEQPVP